MIEKKSRKENIIKKSGIRANYSLDAPPIDFSNMELKTLEGNLKRGY